MRFFIATATLAMLTVATLQPAAAQSPAVQVSNAWSRATPGGASTAAVYATLNSPAGDTLTGASSPVAKTASVHEMSMDGNVMRMRPVTGGLALPPGQAVTLQPGGYHIMLEGLKVPLKQGQTVPLHLTFSKSAPVDVTATVAAIGASGPASGTAGHSGMKMP